MQPNPVLHQLGFASDDRLVIIHADDLGLCQAGLDAFDDLVDFGLVSSGAVMVPCPWFPAVAAFARRRPAADIGVHATLNSEWDSMRWGPISTRDPASGLIDAEGYFHRRSEDVQAEADPEAVAAELQAQVDRALAAGIDVTHIDTHMGTVAHPRFVSAYVQTALARSLPAMIMRLDQAGWRAMGMSDEMAALAAGLVGQLEEQGLPLVDQAVGLWLDRPDDRLEQAKQTLGALQPGVTHFIIHPAKDTPELRAICPDWRARVADYQTFTSEHLRAFVYDSGITIIGYRALRDLMRGAARAE